MAGKQRMRWRKYNDFPETHRLRKGCGDDVVEAVKKNGEWSWRTLSKSVPDMDTLPVDSFDAVKGQVERWRAKHGV